MSTCRVMSGTDATCADYQPAWHNPHLPSCACSNVAEEARRHAACPHVDRERVDRRESRAASERAGDELATGFFLLPTASPASRPSALPQD